MANTWQAVRWRPLRTLSFRRLILREEEVEADIWGIKEEAEFGGWTNLKTELPAQAKGRRYEIMDRWTAADDSK
jgi:hypothetical protein